MKFIFPQIHSSKHFNFVALPIKLKALKTIAVIPARFAATRFPGKLMEKLGNQSVILTTYQNTVKTGLFDEVFVVTDAALIFDEIQQNGGKAIMSQAEHATGSDRIAEAIQDLDCDIVINVQGDEPFVNKDALAKLIEVYLQDEQQEISLATLAQEITALETIHDPNCVKVNWDIHHFALYFSRSPIPYPRANDFTARYFQHIGIYAFRKNALLKFAQLPMLQNEKAEKLEQLRYLEYGMKIKVLETDFMGFGIDTPEDLVKANDYLNKKPQL